MIELPMDVYMKTLAGFINDEDKLVTYKWLSKELEVHVNIAKEILEKYWEQHRDENLVATILIIGQIENDGMRVEIVKESDLAKASKKYDKILSQHIYSLQKTLPDIQLLAKCGQGDAKFGAIKCDKCIVLNDEDVFARRWGSAVTYQAPFDNKPVEKNEIAKKPSGIGSFLKEPGETKKKQEEVSKEVSKENKPKESETKKTSPLKHAKGQDNKKGATKKPIQSQKTGFSNLFSKVQIANQKRSPPANESSKESPMEVDTDDKKATTNKANGLFDKKTVPNSLEDKKNTTKETDKLFKKTTIPEKKEEKEFATVAAASASKENKNESSPSVDSKVNESVKTQAKNVKKSRGTKRGRSQDSKEDSKKRKRIVAPLDSSEDSADSDDDRSVIEPSPPREEPVRKNKSPSPPPVQTINGKRKVRKLVDKTFLDEDGFLVTKKMHVYESCSEEDEPAQVVEPKKKEPEPTKVVKKSNKQTTLMSFFKKG